MSAVGQIAAINGTADAALTGGTNTTATTNASASNQAQFEQSIMQAGASVGAMVIMPMIMKLIKRPGEGG